jgi:type I restriction enzyme S subunit
MKSKNQNGWRTVELGEVCEIIKGRKPKLKSVATSGDLPYLIAKVMRGIESPEYASVDDRNSVVVDESETIIICDGSNSGEIFTGFRGILSSTMGKISKKTEIDDGYLRAFLTSTFEIFNGAKSGSAIPHLDKEAMYRIDISLPPKDEQRQIAGRLREQMAEVERARAAVQAQLDATQTLVLALLRESLKTTGRRKWCIAECLSEITQGIGERWSEFPVLGATRAGLAPAKEGVGKYPGRYKPVTPGTVFYNPMRILLGSIALVSEDDKPGITSPDYVVIRGIEGRLHSTWFYYWFRSPAGADFIQSLTRGAVRERLLFNRLAKGEIEIPSWQAQLRVVEQLQEIKNLRRSLETRLAEIELLPATLLRSAFSQQN